MINFILMQFNFSLLFSFLFGVGVGIALMALVYLIIVLSTIRKKGYALTASSQNVSDDEVKQLINETQMIFKDKSLKSYKSNIVFCKDLSYELVLNIARKFYPESKHPLFELSIDEVLMLTIYISNRIDNILDARILRLFRKLKVSQIIGMTELKEKIEANSIVKATKKYKIMEALSAAKKVVNIVNPVYWARKSIVDTAFSVATKKLCLVVIGIVGEETYKIYSKAVFDKVVDLDSGVDVLISDIRKDLSDAVLPEDENNPEVTNQEVKEEVPTDKMLLLDENVDNKKEKKNKRFSWLRKREGE